MELDEEILKALLKGLNELEGHFKEGFEIKGLKSGEASSLQSNYLSNYRVFLSKDDDKGYKLIVSKKIINQRGYYA